MGCANHVRVAHSAVILLPIGEAGGAEVAGGAVAAAIAPGVPVGAVAAIAGVGVFDDQGHQAGRVRHRPGLRFVEPHQRGFEHEAALHAQVEGELHGLDGVIAAIGIAGVIGFAHAADDAAQVSAPGQGGGIGQEEQVPAGDEGGGQAVAAGFDNAVSGHGGIAEGGKAGGDVDEVVRAKAGGEVRREGGADGVAAGELHGMALAVAEAQRFDAAVAGECPGEAGGTVLAAGEQDEGIFVDNGHGKVLCEGRLGGTCRPPQTPRRLFRVGPIGDGGFGGNGTFPPTFLWRATGDVF